MSRFDLTNNTTWYNMLAMKQTRRPKRQRYPELGTFLKEARKRHFNIPIISSDVGGRSARKIFFFPKTGKVMVKKLVANVGKIATLEDKFHEKARLEI